MRPLELHCLFNDTEQAKLEDLGIIPNILSADTRPITFYEIQTLSPYYEQNQDYSCIESGGQEYIISIEYIKLKQIINNHLDKGI
jgi:hypothetical protein